MDILDFGQQKFDVRYNCESFLGVILKIPCQNS